MKTRLALIVLALVILPTAILSLMATRALRSRELVLQDQRETSAANVIQAVSGRIRARLEDDLKQVVVAMSECVGRSVRFRDLEATAARLRDSSETVKQVFLFMNPWGFLYPEVSREESGRLRPGWDFVPMGKQEGTEYDQLLAALRRRIASAGPLTDTIWFTAQNASYCFSPLGNRKSLYAGYEIDPDGFSRLLTDIIGSVSGGEFVLVAERPGGGEEAEVIVTDSFSPVAKTEAEITALPYSHTPILPYFLSAGKLMPPFDYIKIKAFVRDPEEVRRVGRLQSRLYAWSILLMAAGICAGVWLVLREAAVEIQRARSRSDFLVGVSHDLRTPLSSMKMLAESLYLDRVRDPGKQKKFHGTILRECERLADIVERVLFFMREEHKAVKYSFELVDAGQLVRSVVTPFIERMREKVNVDLRMADDLPMIKADSDAMRKVILNLLDNAVKYGKRVESRKSKVESENSNTPLLHYSSTPIEVTVKPVSRRGKEWVRISVRDHGIGMKAGELKKIFEEYYRAPVEASGGMAGVGLGLSLCRKIVKAHRGRIEVESVPGQGSTFSIFLPAAREE